MGLVAAGGVLLAIAAIAHGFALWRLTLSVDAMQEWNRRAADHINILQNRIAELEDE